MGHPVIPSYWERVGRSQVTLGDLPRLGLLCRSWRWPDPACNAELLICFWLYQAGLKAFPFPFFASMLYFPIALPPPTSPRPSSEKSGKRFHPHECSRLRKNNWDK